MTISARMSMVYMLWTTLFCLGSIALAVSKRGQIWRVFMCRILQTRRTILSM